MVSSYSEELLAPNLTPKQEKTSMLADRYCVFAATLPAWRPFLHLQQEDRAILSFDTKSCVLKFAIQKFKY